MFVFNAAQLYAGRVQVMMEFVCCVVVQKPWCFEHKLALTPVRVPSAGQAQGSVVWWFKALVLRGPAGGPKPEGSQARGVSNPGGSKTSDPKHGGPKTRVPSLGVSRPGVPSPGAQAQEGPKPGGVPSLGGPNPRGKGEGRPKPGDPETRGYKSKIKHQITYQLGRVLGQKLAFCLVC